MKFYFLDDAVRTEETGTEYPQILRMTKDHDFFDDRGVYVFTRIALPQTNPDLRSFILERNAKLTDVLSTVMLRLTGFLVNQRVREVFKNHTLPEHKFYDAFVTDVNNIELRYFWLQMMIDYKLGYLDFRRSNFHVESIDESFKSSYQNIAIESLDEFVTAQQKLEVGQNIKISKLYLNSSFSKENPDVFKLPAFSNSWIVSERLAHDLSNKHISGIRLTSFEIDE